MLLVNDFSWLQFVGGLSLYLAMPLSLVGALFLYEDSPVFPRWSIWFTAWTERAERADPQRMRGRLEGRHAMVVDDLPEARQLIAATVMAEQCRRLYAAGVSAFHFYTLNRAELSYATCHLLGLRRKDRQENAA